MLVATLLRECVIPAFGVATTQRRPECMMAKMRTMLGKSSPDLGLNQTPRSCNPAISSDTA